MRSSIIARNSILTFVDTVISYAAVFVTVVLVARNLGPDKLGYFSYVVWIVHVAGACSAFGVPSATRKFVAEYVGKDDVATARAVIRFTLSIQLVSATVVVGVGLCVASIILPSQDVLYASLAIVSIGPSMLMAIPTAVNAAVEDFAPNVISSVVSTLVHVAGVAVALLCSWDLAGLTGALLISRTSDCLLRTLLCHRRFGLELTVQLKGFRFREIDAMLRRRLLRFCGQATGLLLINLIVWERFELLFLRHFCSIREVAFYSMSFGIVRAVALLPLAFARAAGAAVMTVEARQPTAIPVLVTTAVRLLALLTLPLAFGLAALSPALVQSLYGPRYEDAIPVLAILATFSLAPVFFATATDLFAAADRQIVVLKCSLVAAVVNVFLAILLIPARGAVGASLANGAAQAVAAVVIVTIAIREFSICIDWRVFVRILAAASGMALSVVIAVWALDPVAGLVVGGLLGFSTYCVLLRLMKAVDVADADKLIALQSQMPVPLRRWYAAGVRKIAFGSASL